MIFPSRSAFKWTHFSCSVSAFSFKQYLSFNRECCVPPWSSDQTILEWSEEDTGCFVIPPFCSPGWSFCLESCFHPVSVSDSLALLSLRRAGTAFLSGSLCSAVPSGRRCRRRYSLLWLLGFVAGTTWISRAVTGPWALSASPLGEQIPRARSSMRGGGGPNPRGLRTCRLRHRVPLASSTGS